MLHFSLIVKRRLKQNPSHCESEFVAEEIATRFEAAVGVSQSNSNRLDLRLVKSRMVISTQTHIYLQHAHVPYP